MTLNGIKFLLKCGMGTADCVESNNYVLEVAKYRDRRITSLETDSKVLEVPIVPSP